MSSMWLLILPLTVTFGAAALGLLLRRHLTLQRWLSVVSMGILLAGSVALLLRVRADGIQVAQIGGWPAPFGIALVADHLAAIMVVAAAFVAFVVAIYAIGEVGGEHVRFHFHPLYNLLVGGVCGAFLAGDLFNLYVWFEVLLIASFVLMALGNTPHQLEGAIKYAAINLVGSVFFLLGIGMIYGLTGALNLADLARRLPLVPTPGLVNATAMLFIVAFGIKAAIFPLFFWLPASYHTPPVAVSAAFAGLLTKVGVYAMLRVFTLLFVQDTGFTHTLLLWIAGMTMVTGVLGAAAQGEFRRILSFHIISQIGYMVMGLALLTPFGLAGAIYFTIHNMLAKTNLFLISGIAMRLGGTFDLKGLGGLYRRQPALSVLFVISAFSLAGFPPLSGFWGKLILAQAGFAAGQYAIVAVALAVGLMTLYSMSKIWLIGFLPDHREEAPLAAAPVPGAMLLPVYLLVAGILAVSVFAGPVYDLGAAAAAELLDPQRYIQAVLGP